MTAGWRERQAHTEGLRQVAMYQHADGSIEWVADPGAVIAIDRGLVEAFDAGRRSRFVEWDGADGVLTIRTRQCDVVYELIGYDLLRDVYFAVRRSEDVAAA